LIVGEDVKRIGRDVQTHPRRFLADTKEAVPADFAFNSLEFEGIKSRVTDSLLYAEKQDGVLIWKIDSKRHNP